MARTWSKRSNTVSTQLESNALTRGSEEMAMNGRAVDAIVRQLTPQLQHDVGAEHSVWGTLGERASENQVGSALRKQSSGTRITSEIAMPAAPATAQAAAPAPVMGTGTGTVTTYPQLRPSGTYRPSQRRTSSVVVRGKREGLRPCCPRAGGLLLSRKKRTGTLFPWTPGSAIVRNAPRRRMVVQAQLRTPHIPVGRVFRVS
jgi:hypothetical protein